MGKNTNLDGFIFEYNNQLTNELSSVFSKEKLQALARSCGFVKRDSKLTASRFLDILMCAGTSKPQSLEDLCRDMEEAYGEPISKQGIHKRFNHRASEFVGLVLTQLLMERLKAAPPAALPLGFGRILIRDSMRFNLSGTCSAKYEGHGGCVANSSSMISVQTEYNILGQEVTDLLLTSGRRNDQCDSKESLEHIEKGDLLLRDLGYVTTAYLKGVADKGAYFLNRLPSQIKAYYAENPGKELDFGRLERKMKRDKLPYMDIGAVLGKNAKVPCRLLISLLPKAEYDKRLRRASKRAGGRGHSPSAEYRQRAKLNLFITNAPQELIKAQQARGVYSLRWQIELIFKSFKSVEGMDKIRSTNMAYFECMLMARFISVLVNLDTYRCAEQWLLKQGETRLSVSIQKFFSYTNKIKKALGKAVFQEKDLHGYLKKVVTHALKRLLTETRKGHLPIFQIIASLG